MQRRQPSGIFMQRRQREDVVVVGSNPVEFRDVVFEDFRLTSLRTNRLTSNPLDFRLTSL